MKLSSVNGKESKYFDFDEMGVREFDGEVFVTCGFYIDGKSHIAVGKVVEK